MANTYRTFKIRLTENVEFESIDNDVVVYGGRKFDFGVYWDNNTKTVIIDTFVGYKGL